MTKKEFLKKLKSKDLTKDEKLECCQFFIENYVTLVKENIDTDVGILPTGRRIYSKIQGLRINEGSDKAINYAFEQLSSKIDKFKEYEKLV
jgi:hypothetical protein